MPPPNYKMIAIAIGCGVMFILIMAAIYFMPSSKSEDTKSEDSGSGAGAGVSTGVSTGTGTGAGAGVSTGAGANAGSNSGNEDPKSINNGSSSEDDAPEEIPVVEAPVGVEPINCQTGYFYDSIDKKCYKACGPDDILSLDKTRCIRKTPSNWIGSSDDDYLIPREDNPVIGVSAGCPTGTKQKDGKCYLLPQYLASDPTNKGGPLADAMGITRYIQDPVDPSKYYPDCNGRALKYKGWEGNLSWDPTLQQCKWTPSSGYDAVYKRTYYVDEASAKKDSNAWLGVSKLKPAGMALDRFMANCPPGYSLSTPYANGECYRYHDITAFPKKTDNYTITGTSVLPLGNEFESVNGVVYKKCNVNMIRDPLDNKCKPDISIWNSLLSGNYSPLEYVKDTVKNAYKKPSYPRDTSNPICSTGFTYNATDKLCYK